jgi:hypothetical protein
MGATIATRGHRHGDSRHGLQPVDSGIDGNQLAPGSTGLEGFRGPRTPRLEHPKNMEKTMQKLTDAQLNKAIQAFKAQQLEDFAAVR